MTEFRRMLRAYRAASETRPMDVARAVDRLRPSPKRGRPRAFVLVVASVALSLAAAVALAVLHEAQEPSLSQPLYGAVAVLDPSPELRLEVDGAGHLDGTRHEIVITWEVGTLRVAVAPKRGVSLRVDTPEGTIHVVGTEFAVRRDAFGTVVTVTRGEVEVTCGADEATRASLMPKETLTCPPLTAPGLLGRARAEHRDKASITEVLATIDSALALASEPAVGDELRTLRIDVLLAAGDFTAAREAADAYLRSGASHRRNDVLRVAATLSWSFDGCARARAWLDELGEAAADLPAADACRGEK